MRLLLPMAFYSVGMIILLLLYPAYHSSGTGSFQVIPFWMFWLTVISIIVSLFLSVAGFVKKKYFQGIVFLAGAMSMYAMYQKLVFVDYNTFVHLFFVIVLSAGAIICRRQKLHRDIISVFLITNLITIFLPDQFFLSYFNSNKIPWKKTGLRWEDFKDSFSNHSNERYFVSNRREIDPDLLRAITTNAIKYKVNATGSIPSVVVASYFIPDESYIKDEFKTVKQLNHERRYVDICEYHARIIRQTFKNKTTGMVDYKILFKKYDMLYIDGMLSSNENAERFIENIIRRKEKMNERYMLETEFGQNAGKQKEWDERISRLLKESEEYK